MKFIEKKQAKAFSRLHLLCTAIKKPIVLLVLTLVTISLFSIDASAQRTNRNRLNIRVRIDQPISKEFPDMKAYLSVVNRKNEPILSLIKGNFKVLIDGKLIKSSLDVAGFQYAEDGISYAVLIAGNGLMEGAPLEKQKQAAVNLSEYLRDQDRLSVYIFADEVKPVFELQKKNESLVQKINKIDVMGKSPHFYDALVIVARKLAKAPTKRKVIIMMSDGRDTDSRFTEKKLFSELDKLNIPVYGIGIKLMSGQNLYRVANTAKRSGGGYQYTPKLNGIPTSMRILYNQISLGYVIKFNVDSVEPDNNLHQLQVKVNYKGSEANAFKNFVAYKSPVPLWVIILIIVLSVVIIALIIIFFIIRLRKVRKEMGIAKRKCPDCGRRLKDDWDECMFCKHDPPKKKKGLIARIFNK